MYIPQNLEIEDFATAALTLNLKLSKRRNIEGKMLCNIFVKCREIKCDVLSSYSFIYGRRYVFSKQMLQFVNFIKDKANGEAIVLVVKIL